MSGVSQQHVVIPNKIKDFYKMLNISPVNLLKEYAMSVAYSKIDKYNAESTFFQRKYKCSFEEFRAKVDEMENEENFEWEDDLMDWEFAYQNLKYWKNKLSEIQE
jgi:hypothetical protein